MTPRVLLVSNGYGEDGIACRLGVSLKNHGASVIAAPIIGKGIAYRDAGIDTIATTKMPPSGGFIRTRTDLFNDIKFGIVGQMYGQRQRIQSTDSECVVVVGDVFALLMGYRKHRPIAFLPTAKSDRFMPHSWVEKWLIKTMADWVYPRDVETTTSLRAFGINAHFFGNPMMDGLTVSAPNQATDSIVIAVLPGSRTDALANLQLIINTTKSWPLAFKARVAVSPNVDRDAVQSILTQATRPTQDWVVSTDFADAVGHAHCVIGLAGTANEQAIWLGKPVVTFVGNGPQTTPTRLREQQRLLGDRLIVADHRDPNAVFRAVQHALSLPIKSTPPVQQAANAITTHLYQFL